MSKHGFKSLGLGVALMAAAAVAPAQDLVKEALASFPMDTVRLEYSSPAKLRQLQEYSRLHERYLGPSLRNLEAHLASLGVRESDLNEVVLGWQPSASGLTMEGITLGQFDPQAMARQAESQGIAATPIGSTSAYCFGSTDTAPCVAVLGRGLGAFGTLDAVHAIVDVRGGETSGLSANPSFSSLVKASRKDTAIWGVATGVAIEDWFKTGMPVQKNLPVDLGSVFKNVQSLAYSVAPTDRVRVNVEMACTSAASAGVLRQQFDTLRLFQKMAWQQQYPGVANPFEDLTIGASGSTLTLGMSTPYSALEAAKS
ncbi:MAG TPA: hypothetical protein VG206_24935 [Terriglobia bacterium]|nr:hypothetical protein [Terriglobia bacterium]